MWTRFIFAVLIGSLCGCDNATPIECDAETGVTFELSFQGMWTSESHPIGYPSNAHFSPIIGTVHDADTHLWTDGGTASAGIENMAEAGTTGELGREIEELVENGNACGVLVGSGISNDGTTTLTFRANDDYPYLTMTTMIAPSPDWFIGVDSLLLKDSEGEWIEQLSIDLFGYDAGTEDGDGFSLSNPATDPQAPISKLSGGDFATKFGVFTLRLDAAE